MSSNYSVLPQFRQPPSLASDGCNDTNLAASQCRSVSPPDPRERHTSHLILPPDFFIQNGELFHRGRRGKPVCVCAPAIVLLGIRVDENGCWHVELALSAWGVHAPRRLSIPVGAYGSLPTPRALAGRGVWPLSKHRLKEFLSSSFAVLVGRTTP